LPLFPRHNALSSEGGHQGRFTELGAERKEEKHDYPHRDSGDSHYAFLRSLIKPTQGCQLECAVSEPAQRTAVADRPRNIQWDALIKLIKQDATRQQATET
jgi:hypothetical protein